MKRSKERGLIKVPRVGSRGYHWSKLEVFKVDLGGKKLVPAESTGQRAVFVGDVRSNFSLTSLEISASSRQISFPGHNR
jgi:hypothetical protein